MSGQDRDDRATRIAAMRVVADLYRNLGLLTNAGTYALSQLQQAEDEVDVAQMRVRIARSVRVLADALDETARPTFGGAS